MQFAQHGVLKLKECSASVSQQKRIAKPTPDPDGGACRTADARGSYTAWDLLAAAAPCGCFVPSAVLSGSCRRQARAVLLLASSVALAIFACSRLAACGRR